MFGWFQSKPPTCPVAVDVREWLDESWTWLQSFFGRELIRQVEVILPRREFLPDTFNHTEADAHELCARLCDYMRFPRQHVILHFSPARPPANTSLDQPPFPLWIDKANLEDASLLVGVLVRELGYLRLWGSDRFAGDAEEIAPLADLVTVYLGLGVIAANTVLHESYWHAGHTSGWSMQYRGVMSMPSFGYALALFARDRGEDGTLWRNELRPDVRQAFDQAQRYLNEVG